MIKNLFITTAIMLSLWVARRSVLRLMSGNQSEEKVSVQALLQEQNGGSESLTLALAKAVDQSENEAKNETKNSKEQLAAPAVQYHRPTEELLAPMPTEIYELFAGENPEPAQIGEKLLKYLESIPEEDVKKRIELLRLAQQDGVATPEQLTRIGLRQAEVPSDDYGLSLDQLEALKLGANLVAKNANTLAQAATLYTQIVSLHSSPEVQRELQIIFFNHPQD